MTNRLLRFDGKDLQNIDFEPWLEQKPGALHLLARKWFEAIKNCGPDVVDIFHDHYPIGCVGDAPFAYVNVFSQHVNLGFFYGAELPDPSGLLEGKGRRMRHIKLRVEMDINDQEILTILQHAYLDIKERILQEGYDNRLLR